MKEFWNQKYSTQEYAYGEEPNVYFKDQLVKLEPGNILLPADGEGRNSVFASREGWKVSAFDISDEGYKKAQILAEKYQVCIEYQIGDIENLEYQEEQFDVIAVTYPHFTEAKQIEYYKKLSGYLKKGGVFIFEAFSKKHLVFRLQNRKVGGPADEDLLFSLEEVKKYFIEYNILELQELELEMHEGTFHNGLSSIIRFTGIKL